MSDEKDHMVIYGELNAKFDQIIEAVAILEELLPDQIAHTRSVDFRGQRNYSRLETLADRIAILNKIVTDGNGEKSLVARVALLEADLEDLQALRVRYEAAEEARKIQEDKEKKDKQDLERTLRVQRWAIYITIAIAVIGFIIGWYGKK